MICRTLPCLGSGRAIDVAGTVAATSTNSLEPIAKRAKLPKSPLNDEQLEDEIEF
jgi:hypothetical protein